MSASKLKSVAGFIGAAVLAAAIAPGASAFAADTDGQVSIRMSVADLNMNGEAGAQEALARIRNAAKLVCGGSDGERSLNYQMRVRACVADAVERAVAASNQPTLIAVSQGRHVATLASAAP